MKYHPIVEEFFNTIISESDKHKKTLDKIVREYLDAKVACWWASDKIDSVNRMYQHFDLEEESLEERFYDSMADVSLPVVSATGVKTLVQKLAKVAEEWAKEKYGGKE